MQPNQIETKQDVDTRGPQTGKTNLGLRERRKGFGIRRTTPSDTGNNDKGGHSSPAVQHRAPAPLPPFGLQPQGSLAPCWDELNAMSSVTTFLNFLLSCSRQADQPLAHSVVRHDSGSHALPVTENVSVIVESLLMA